MFMDLFLTPNVLIIVCNMQKIVDFFPPNLTLHINSILNLNSSQLSPGTQPI